jgi:hypothetical protein
MATGAGTDDRIEQLRVAIAAGSYAPDPGAVAESVLAWVAPPELLAGLAEATVADPAKRTTETPRSRR